MSKTDGYRLHLLGSRWATHCFVCSLVMQCRLLLDRAFTRLDPVAAQFSDSNELQLSGVAGACAQQEESCLCTL